MMKNVYDLNDDELYAFTRETLKWCTTVVRQNDYRMFDDSGDYVEGAVDIMHLVTELFRNDDYDEMRHQLHDLFNQPGNSDDHAYARFASDAIPDVWDEFIVNERF
jgi:hypothetical protein